MTPWHRRNTLSTGPSQCTSCGRDSSPSLQPSCRKWRTQKSISTRSNPAPASRKTPHRCLTSRRYHRARFGNSLLPCTISYKNWSRTRTCSRQFNGPGITERPWKCEVATWNSSCANCSLYGSFTADKLRRLPFPQVGKRLWSTPDVNFIASFRDICGRCSSSWERWPSALTFRTHRIRASSPIPPHGTTWHRHLLASSAPCLDYPPIPRYMLPQRPVPSPCPRY